MSTKHDPNIAGSPIAESKYRRILSLLRPWAALAAALAVLVAVAGALALRTLIPEATWMLALGTSFVLVIGAALFIAGTAYVLVDLPETEDPR